MRILCLGSVNCWLITSSDTGHNQSPVPNINTAHFSWQRLNQSDAPTTLLNSITSYTEVRELFFVASEKMLFTPSKISSSVSSDCAAATNMRKFHFLSIHTQIYIFAAFFLFAVLSCCYTDPLPTELTGSAERLIWETSTSECFLSLIKSDTDKEFHLVRIYLFLSVCVSCSAAKETEHLSNPSGPDVSSWVPIRGSENVPLCFPSVHIWEKTSSWKRFQCWIAGGSWLFLLVLWCVASVLKKRKFTKIENWLERN